MLTSLSGLFGADTDIEHTAVLGKDIFQGNDAGVTWLLAQVLLIAPLDVQAFYVQEYKLDQALASITFATVRQKLDGGLGDKLFQKYRGFEQNDESSFFPDESKYRVIMLGVLTIMVGAKIKAEDLQHLRDLVPTVQCHEGFAFPIAGDNCFRGPGKRQFLAALDHYEAGIPRNFLHSCCHACGKTAVDVGHGLAKCCGCQNYISAAYFCDKVR